MCTFTLFGLFYCGILPCAACTSLIKLLIIQKPDIFTMENTYESDIEKKFIDLLVEQKYTYRSDIRTREALDQNFREKFNATHYVTLSDDEFARLRSDLVNADVFRASKFLRQQQYFERDDGTPLYYNLVNTKKWCKNKFEVINQLQMKTTESRHRYDVILLVNGLPLVQIELKRLDVSPRKAMKQIVDYKNDPGNGYTNSLLCFMQLFIVSNQTNTYYFANNKNEHFNFNADEQFLPVYQFANEQNNKITHLTPFTERFLNKCTLGEMLSKYMVLVEVEQKILVMRPYQVYAVKAIVDCIEQNRGNGYVWHTTGSGKTLTSFKASTLLKENPDIEKCLFVVDRKDLDRQTRMEFNKFQEGSVEANTNTGALVRRLLSDDYTDKVIVTTIQKLGLALTGASKKDYREQLKPLSQKRLVFIFDECHRSQFGDNHKAIKEFFPKAQLFGFTGTPIFEENATYRTIEGEQASYKTTQDIFEKELHNYTITHAIDNKNVLRFHVDYYTQEGKDAQPGDMFSRQVIADAILEKHDRATGYRRFNAIFATASIKDAIDYYKLLKAMQIQKQDADPAYKPLNIACVFSPPAQLASDKNKKDIEQIQDDLEQEKVDNQQEPEKKKEALEGIIADYNTRFGTNHHINEFDLYYQDVQQRIKDQQYNNRDYAQDQKIDLTIVVDMLLTGFDSKYLNTLYVNKNLKYHGLVQAFSRTNRVLNDTKPYGNIMDFRGQQDAVNQAIALFSGEHKQRAKEVWMVDAAPTVIDHYQEVVKKLGDFMVGQGLENEPHEAYNLKGDGARIAFVKNFKEVQRLKTQLEQYTDLSETQKTQIEQILPTDRLREYKSAYLETAKQLDKTRREKPDQTEADGWQEFDFELVLFASAMIDYDYIMGLIADSTQNKPNKEKMSREEIKQLLRSQSNFMDEQEVLEAYIDSLDWGRGYSRQELTEGYAAFKASQQAEELAGIAAAFGLEVASLRAFVDEVMNRMIFDGERLTDLLAPLELGWKARRKQEIALMEELVPYFKKLAQGQEISGLSAYED